MFVLNLHNIHQCTRGMKNKSSIFKKSWGKQFSPYTLYTHTHTHIYIYMYFEIFV